MCSGEWCSMRRRNSHSMLSAGDCLSEFFDMTANDASISITHFNLPVTIDPIACAIDRERIKSRELAAAAIAHSSASESRQRACELELAAGPESARVKPIDIEH